jgi:quercetin 2,3-dioxygenase
MLKILRAKAGRSFKQGPFRIRRIRPGAILGHDADPAFGPLSVVDHANLDVGTLVHMHEHTNDEILTYLWRGTMVHEDSGGYKVALSPNKLMMMNAGRGFWHEESTPETPVAALQIFIRPLEADLAAGVQFFDRPAPISTGHWHLIGGPATADAPLKIRQQVRVYDARLAGGQILSVPTADNLTPWLYVMDGAVREGSERFVKGEAATDLDAALPAIHAEADATLVLFLVDRSARATRDGTISGT